MEAEIEAKFLNVDFGDVRNRLTKEGAVLKRPMRMMRRVVLDYPDRRMQATGNAWVRVRDEGDKVTLTYKTSIENQFGGATEIETTVGSYEKTIAIFTSLGFIVHSQQETKRETWQLGDVEIVLDEWPWLEPFIEIEGPTKMAVQDTAKKLGFDWQDSVFGSVTTAYRKQYPAITKDEHISTIPEIKFNQPRPEWFTKGKK